MAISVYLQKPLGHHMVLKVRSLLCVGGDGAHGAQDLSLVERDA